MCRVVSAPSWSHPSKVIPSPTLPTASRPIPLHRRAPYFPLPPPPLLRPNISHTPRNKRRSKDAYRQSPRGQHLHGPWLREQSLAELDHHQYLHKCNSHRCPCICPQLVKQVIRIRFDKFVVFFHTWQCHQKKDSQSNGI